MELGLKVAKELPSDSMDRLWYDSSFYRYRGDEFRQQQDHERASEAYRQSIKLKEEYLTKFSGDGPRAKDRVEVAQTLLLNAHVSLGGTYVAMGKLNQAFETYQTGLVKAKEWKVEFPQSPLFLGVGDIRFRRNDFDGARDEFHRALELARRHQRPDRISNAARRIGDVLRATGKSTEAVTFYREAIEQVESVRSLMASQSNRRSYFGGSLQAYWGMIASQWETGAHARAFDYGERARSRSFLDMLGSKVRLSNRKSGLIDEEIALVERRTNSPIDALAEGARGRIDLQARLEAIWRSATVRC